MEVLKLNIQKYKVHTRDGASLDFHLQEMERAQKQFSKTASSLKIQLHRIFFQSISEEELLQTFQKAGESSIFCFFPL